MKVTTDNLVLATTLSCDTATGVVGCRVIERNPDVPPERAHCEWELDVRNLDDDDVDALRKELRRQQSVAYSIKCPMCGLAWMTSGPCGSDCEGGWPPPRYYDLRKGAVISLKRKAQAEYKNNGGGRHD